MLRLLRKGATLFLFTGVIFQLDADLEIPVDAFLGLPELQSINGPYLFTLSMPPCMPYKDAQ